MDASPSRVGRRLLRLARRLVVVGVVGAAVAWGGYRLLDLVYPLPASALAPPEASPVTTAADGTPMHVGLTSRGERRLEVPLAEMSRWIPAAVVASEDRRFYDHVGVDPRAFARAVWVGVTGSAPRQGASTITMQLARIVAPSARDVGGKLAQSFRALQLEERLSKDEILERYLNLVPLGGNLRGVGAASHAWFGRRPADLGPAEAALLASVLPAPGRFDPRRDPEGARARRDRVLGRMRATGALDEAAFAAATAAPLGLDPHAFPDVAPHAWSRAGAGRTCVMPTLQTAVEAIAARAEGVDGIGIVALDVATGGVQVLVGGRAPDARTLDATSRPRSAGSTLKPFLWALAYDEGLAAPGTRLLDLPWTSPEWAPEDFDRTPRGPVAAAEALSASLNLPAVRLAAGLPPGRFPAALRGLGFAHVRDASAGPAIDLALGTDDVTALELAAAYAALVRGDAPGLSRGACGLVLEALSDPARARTAGAPAQGVAWKTGTSSRRRDAWAVGATRRVVAVVWRGRLDGGSDPRLVGVEAAVPTLFEVIGVLDPDPLPFDAPSDVTRVTVCAETGLAAGPACGATRVDRRPAGARALRPCDVHRRIEVDAATGALLCARCRAERSVRTIDVALHGPVLGAWRAAAGLPVADLPRHDAACTARVEPVEARPAFAAPRAGARAVAGREGTASIAVRVLAPDPATWLTLVVDAEPPRRVPSGVGVEVTLSAGRHVLTALSASGRAATTEVEVVAGR